MSKSRKISDSNLEHIVLTELKEADRDVFIGVVEHLYPVKVEYDVENETFELTPTVKDMSLTDVFGANIMLSLFEEEEAEAE